VARQLVYEGPKFKLAFARERSGACPGAQFFDQLNLSDKAKLMALFKYAADHADFRNTEKFGDLGNGLFEFKSFQIRMPFAYAKNERKLILITHGFVKKSRKTSTPEITRAWRIFNEDQDGAALTLVKKS
jgi:phage-related protein